MTCKDRTQRTFQGSENRFLLVSSDPVTQVFFCAVMTAEASVSVGCRCVKTEHLFAPSHPPCFSQRLLGRLCRSWLGSKGDGGVREGLGTPAKTGLDKYCAEI